MINTQKTKRSIVTTLAATMIVACNSGGTDMSEKTASLHGITYRFPMEHISASVFPPDGRLYVQLAPPGANFHLVLDEWGGRPSPHGPDVSRISRLSDNRFGKFGVIPSAEGPIVCDLGPQPHLNCGIQVQDGPVSWGVLFDKEQVKNAPEIMAQATSLFDSYRSDHAE